MGRVYKLKARNFGYGVWVGDGFIGVREKFGNVYLFKELHWDDGEPFGTVQPLEEVGEVPKGVPLTETINEKFIEDKWGGHIQAENNKVLMEFLTKVERDQAKKEAKP
jgi:hypothetical protein